MTPGCRRTWTLRSGSGGPAVGPNTWVRSLTSPYADPIIGVLVNGLDPASDSGKSEMQNYSIAILGRIFDDPRASSATLLWYNLETGDDGTTQLEAAMVVGILRQTAAGIDWASLRAVELADEVDLYRDLEAEATGIG